MDRLPETPVERRRWQALRHAVVGAVLARGVHADLIAAVNSYLLDTIRVFEQNFSITHDDPVTGYTHTLRARNCYFVLPRTPDGNLDSPYKAMHRENYEASVKGTLCYKVTNAAASPVTVVFESETREFEFFQYPVVMNSALCTSTTGEGTARHTVVSSNFSMPAFCVNRTFKVCPLEETFALNTPLVFQVDRCEIRCQFTRMSRIYRTNSTLRIVCRAMKNRSRRQWVQRYTYELEVPYEQPKSRVPVHALLLLLDCDPATFRGLVHSITPVTTPAAHRALDACLDCVFWDAGMDWERAMDTLVQNMSRARSQETAAEQHSFVQYTIAQEFFPNAQDNRDKVTCLARCMARLIRNSTPFMELTLSPPDLDDKTAYTHKRVESVGYKLCVLLRKYTKHLSKRAVYHLRKALTQTPVVQKPDTWTKIVSKRVIKLTASVRNGNWDTKADTSETNLNKTQLLGTGFCSDGIVVEAHKIVRSFLRRSTTTPPLLTHPTQHGRVCMYLTPESERCAVTRFKAIGARVTPNPDHDAVSTGLEFMCSIAPSHGTDYRPHAGVAAAPGEFTITGTLGFAVGLTKTPKRWCTLLRACRRRGILPRYTGFSVTGREVRVLVDAGRIQRPLLIASKAKELGAILPLLETMRDPCAFLVENGFLEFLCAEEEYLSDVLTDNAPGGQGSHIEIHGALSLSLTVARLFANHNQGPRRMYTGNLEKRAMAFKSTEDFGTTVSHSLWYPQAPVMSEIIEHTLQSRSLEPNGATVRVAIMSLGGNIEDAWVVSKHAIDRGLLVSDEQRIVTHMATHKSTFSKPGEGCQQRSESWKYDALRSDGTPRIGATLRAGMAVVGKTITTKGNHGLQSRCASKFMQGNEKEYTVQSVTCYPDNCTHKDVQLVRVVLHRSHTPQIGDKFFLSHGQKGTIGKVVPDEDLPFSVVDGSTPDVILNVCSLMRVTLGLLLEMLGSRTRALCPGRICQYETLFQHAMRPQERSNLWAQILKELGYSPTGKDRFRDGITGRLIQAPLFHGLASLRALKQLSKDKLRCRDRGRVNELSRQTTVGRKNKGGLRAGEMELFNMVSFGAPHLKLNMTYEAADKFHLPVCKQCSNVALGNGEDFMCGYCGTGDHVRMVDVAYITNLVTQELSTLGIALDLNVGEA